MEFVTETEKKIEIIRQYRIEGESADYERGTSGTSSVRLALPDGEYAFSLTASEIHEILEEFPVSSVEELFG